jgi:hypothetical protein
VAGFELAPRYVRRRPWDFVGRQPTASEVGLSGLYAVPLPKTNGNLDEDESACACLFRTFERGRADAVARRDYDGGARQLAECE